MLLCSNIMCSKMDTGSDVTYIVIRHHRILSSILYTARLLSVVNNLFWAEVSVPYTVRVSPNGRKYLLFISYCTKMLCCIISYNHFIEDCLKVRNLKQHCSAKW